MKRKKLYGLGALLLLALTLMPIPLTQAAEEASPVQQEIGTNLLVNPGFEGIGKPQDNSLPNPNNWTRDTFNGIPYGEIFTPEGWVTWWQEGDFKRPECKVIPNEHPFNSDPKRIHQGYYSGMCFTFFGKQNAGYFQVVRNIPPNSTVEGSFYAHAWSCSEDNPPLSCGDPYAFYFRVGIDPNGGTDPFSTNIVWGAPSYIYDKFGKIGPVQATVGQSGVATLFIQAYGKWPNKHNDAYFDDAALTLVSAGETPTPTPEPPPPTSEIPPTPRFTPTPRPDGAVVHVVVEGDTLFGIAITYGVDLDEIYRLNNLGPNDILSIGQEIVVSASPNAVAPTPTPQPPAETPAATPTPEGSSSGTGGVPVAPVGNTASLCVLAFYDANNDLLREADSGEMPLPNAEINLLGTSGPVGTYTTDGIREPYCFENLQPGNYILRHTPPPGYKAPDAGQWNILLGAGQVSTLELGYVRDGGAVPNAEGTAGGTPTANQTPEQPTESGGSSGVTGVLNTVLRVSGIIVLLLAIAVGVLFFLSRRSG